MSDNQIQEDMQIYTKLALFKGHGDWMDRAIRFKTKSNYSHCEILLPNGDWYTSHINYGGVTKMNIKNYNPENWDFVELPWIEPAQVIDLYEKTKHDKYNLMGALGHVLGVGFPGKKRKHCAEWCATLLGLSNPVLYSPESIYQYALMTLKNYELTQQNKQKNDQDFTSTIAKISRGKFV